MRIFLKRTIVTLFNPISPIVTLIVGWILTILVTHPDERFPAFINYMINNQFFIATLLIFWLIFAVIYTDLQNNIDTLRNEIEHKDIIITEKENQLKHTSGIVLSRSGDFANFNRLLRFNEILKDFTENNTIVECTQMYSYSTKRSDNVITIKVLYDCGFCSDGVDTNNLAQCHYDINYNDYNTLKYVIDIWKKLSSDTYFSYAEKDSLILPLVDGINSLYRKYYKDLMKIENINQVTDIHFTEYRIITLLLRLARRSSTTVINKNRILGNNKAEIENYLLNGKRTGILSSILLGELFMFKYTRNSHKKGGRAYVSFPMNISMKQYICVFSIQTSDLDKNIDLEYEIKSLEGNIVERFKRSSV